MSALSAHSAVKGLLAFCKFHQLTTISDKANTVHNQTTFQKPSILKALVCYKIINPSMLFSFNFTELYKNTLPFYTIIDLNLRIHVKLYFNFHYKGVSI